MVEFCPGVMEDGLKATVTPAGDVADRATVPLNPPCTVMPIVIVVEEPCEIVRLDRLFRVKSGGGAVTVMLAAVLTLPV